jgi:hypothetical protein
MSKNSKKEVQKSQNPQLFSLPKFKNKQTSVSFSLEDTSHDGGLLLINEVAQYTGLIAQLADCLTDSRHQSYVRHSFDSLIHQRVMQIAAGYEDTNDCNSLKDDGILKYCTQNQAALATQPTMCRLENQPGAKTLYKMGKAIIDNFISSYAEAPKIIILDCDDTSAITYGQQELALFNNYYGDYCYMPLHIYEGLSGKLITSILKPGRRSKSVNVFSILRRIILYLQQHWSNTIIVLRGDGHFCSKEFMDWKQGQKNIEFITGLTGNRSLNELAGITINSATNEFRLYQKPVKRYHSFLYQADSWQHAQRVVVKVEVNEMGTNIRYIVSSLQNIRAKELYEKGYCARGAAELRIKDHKTYLHSDRMSCSSFLANQFRLFLHSAAYVLIHTLQNEVLKGTEYCHATMKTIQLKLIKIAARVKIMKSKVCIELPVAFATKHIFEKCFLIFNAIRT